MSHEMIQNIKNALKDEDRHKKYRGNNNPLFGHCYVASEVYYHLMGGKSSGLKPMTIKHENNVHWFLCTSTGKIIDITASQFLTPVPYHLARGRGFLTKNPSKRSLKVMQRITG